MKNTISKLLALSLVLGSAQAETIFTVNADAANSSVSDFGGSVGATVNDGFTYDPASPTSPLPNQVHAGTAAYHGSGGNGVAKNLSYTLSASFTTTILEPTVVIDLYGRESLDCCNDRDDNIDVQLFNGDYVTAIATVTGLSIDNAGSNGWARATFDSLPVGTTFDRYRAVGISNWLTKPVPF